NGTSVAAHPIERCTCDVRARTRVGDSRVQELQVLRTFPGSAGAGTIEVGRTELSTSEPSHVHHEWCDGLSNGRWPRKLACWRLRRVHDQPRSDPAMATSCKGRATYGALAYPHARPVHRTSGGAK